MVSGRSPTPEYCRCRRGRGQRLPVTFLPSTRDSPRDGLYRRPRTASRSTGSQVLSHCPAPVGPLRWGGGGRGLPPGSARPLGLADPTPTAPPSPPTLGLTIQTSDLDPVVLVPCSCPIDPRPGLRQQGVVVSNPRGIWGFGSENGKKFTKTDGRDS